ncbi:hypothetical protein PPERSA_05922 [Pseudocohnilembus persalinus]|uniref:Plasma membrane fusion protein PRM1 n=1 Tax=Pseudocohnilembus persalinus TaxID=266149 RepID=A0A0V0R4U6_PSEPJ|nr:hypothetical protein PPERSA_05922 [Pseudocohnilembus persalinus]|eukprot:KRX09253.1 hypothetical protein PPERSA_05922 [Pseudocohnilembus persalinus]
MYKVLKLFIILGLLTSSLAQENSRRILTQEEAESLKTEVCSEVSSDGNQVIEEDRLESWEKKSPKKETEGIALKWPLIGSSVAGLSVLIVSCIGVSRAGGIQSSVDSLFCFGQIALYGANYGDDSDDSEYGGLQQLVDDIVDFQNTELANLFSEIDTYFGTNDLSWMTTHKDRIDNTESYLKQECSAASDCCDQLNTGSDGDICVNGDWGTGAITYTYSTDFSAYGGQASTSSIYFAGSGSTSVWDTTVDAYDQAFEEIYTSLYDAISEMKTQGYELSQQGVTSFNQNLDDGIQLVKDFQDDAYQYQLDLNDYHEDAKNYTSLFTTVVQIFFIFFIVFSIGIMGLSVLFVFKKPYKLRYFLHFSWCIFIFTAVLTFILAGISLAVGYMGQQTCTVMSNSIYDAEMHQRYVDNGVLEQDMADKIFICSRSLNTKDSQYGGDGSITQVFNGLSDTLADINSLSDKMADFGNQAGSASDNVDDLNALVTAINNWESDLGDIYTQQEYQVNGNYIDERSDISDIRSSFDTEVNTDCSYNDKMYQQTGNCGSGYSALTGNEDDTSTANSYCVYMVTGYDTATNVRYSSGNCGGSTDVHDIIDDLNAHMTESSALFEDFKQKQLQSYSAVVNDFITDYVADATNIEGFISANQAAIDKIAGPNGIIQSVECFWIGIQLENAYKVMCGGFVYSIYELGVILSWFSFTIFFTSFFIYFSVRRLGNNARINQKVNQQEPGYEMAEQNVNLNVKQNQIE